MASRISYEDALIISQKGKYYPQPTNHAGLPVRAVFCDYCGRYGLGGSWKHQDKPQWDLCMQCYVALQSSNITSTEYTNPTTINNNNAFPISDDNYKADINPDIHKQRANYLNNNSHAARTWGGVGSGVGGQDPSPRDSYEYKAAWISDVPGSYSNKIITSTNGWNPVNTTR